ncbi:MAG: tetratricopeptide repeat protein [Bryobacterales bacterium]|nr:tetratricopeptide repeat protein [Bryobacterales bacterium]
MRATLLILPAALLAFAGTLAAPFYLDDFALLADPAVTSPDGWRQAWAITQTRPLTWFTFWADYQLGGANPAGYHLVNLLLHLGCVRLVAATLRRLIPTSAVWIAAALFALHPIQTEAVIYVFARATLLMTLFCLLSLREWTLGRHWRAAAWFLPALLAKEECAAFPLFLLLLHFSISRNRKELAPIGLMSAMSLAAGVRVLYATAVTAGSGAGVQSGVSPLSYFLAQGIALWRYLRLLVIPHGFTIESPLHPSLLAGLCGWLAIAALLLISLRRFARAREGFWGLSALTLIAPSSTIFPAADLAADRRVYLPMLALAALAALLLQARPKWLPLTLLAVFSLVSLRQTLLWQDSASLWREAVHFNPDKIRPRIQLARQLPPPAALEVLKEALTLAPNDPAVASEMGKVYLESGDAQRALAAFGRALALAPNDPAAINNRGAALFRLGQRPAAEADFRRALQIDPCLFDALVNLRALGLPASPPPDCRYTPQQRGALQ